MNFLIRALVRITHYHDHTILDNETLRILKNNLPCIVASTHTSAFDGLYFIYVLNKLGYNRQVYFLTKQEAFKNPFISFVLRKNNYISVDRDKPQKSVLNKCYEVLKSGGIIALSPAGTRTDNYNDIAFKRGAAHLSYKAHVPIQPIAIVGARRLKFAYIFKRHNLILQAGKPIFPDSDFLDSKEIKSHEKRINEQLQKELARLHDLALRYDKEQSEDEFTSWHSNIFIESIIDILASTIGRFFCVKKGGK